MTKLQVLRLYRRTLRVTKCFPDKSMAKKLQYNMAEVIRLRRYETDPTRIERFIDDGEKLLRLYESLVKSPRLFDAMRRKPMRPH